MLAPSAWGTRSTYQARRPRMIAARSWGAGTPTRKPGRRCATSSGRLPPPCATMADVVRTRIFAVNIDQWQEIGRAHGEVFATIRPATTMVEVRRLIDPDMLVEIEAEAVIGA